MTYREVKAAIELTIEFRSGYERGLILDLPLHDHDEWWTNISQSQNAYDLNDEPVAVWLGPEWRKTSGAERVILDDHGEWVMAIEDTARAAIAKAKGENHVE